MLLRFPHALATAMLICWVGDAPAVDWSREPTPELHEAQRQVAEERWAHAIVTLANILAESPNDPDALTLMGYALRNSERLAEAKAVYLRALRIAPDHVGANEYFARLLLQQGDIDGATERLLVIEQACNGPCEAAVELRTAIECASRQSQRPAKAN